jgi:hypothetical protein
LLARAKAVSDDTNTNSEVLKATELALAEVRASVATPPRWTVSEVAQSELRVTGSSRTWALRIASSLAAAIAIVGLSIGWSAVAAAARSQTGR